MNLFIIPGNPPALHFYKLWAEEIQREQDECSVCISPYPQLAPNADSSQYLIDTAAAHARELLAFHERVQKKAILIGHSIGAWMALHLLKEHGQIIEDCLLLYPFLQKPNVRGRMILRCVHYLYKAPFIEQILLGCRTILEQFFEDLKHVTNEELRISLALAYHEHKVIGQSKENLCVPKHIHKKLHMLYCDQDTWCPSRTINALKTWISCEKMATTHGFITSERERSIVLKALFSRQNLPYSIKHPPIL